MNLKTIDKARVLLLAHSESDFVSRSDARQCADELSETMLINNAKTQFIIDCILSEVEKAETKHPNWPDDIIHQAAIVAEESGELVQACLQCVYEAGQPICIQKEAIHTIVTAFRLLKNFDILDYAD